MCVWLKLLPGKIIKIAFQPVMTRMRIVHHLRVMNRPDCQNAPIAKRYHASDAEKPSDILHILDILILTWENEVDE